MSSIITQLRRLFTALFAAEQVTIEPDCMSLQDWADLPPHHPASDRAPC